MNVKNVCTVALLMFVATSIAVLVAKSLRPTNAKCGDPEPARPADRLLFSRHSYLSRL